MRIEIRQFSAASVQLSGGGMLGLYTDISNANYNNAISVTGNGELVTDVADASGPASNMVSLGRADDGTGCATFV